MNEERQSRVDESVPKPAPAQELSEQEKRDLEKSSETEHAHGRQKEELAQGAQEGSGQERTS